MKLRKAARTILSVTAIAWSIPFAQANATRQSGITRAQAGNAELMKLDANKSIAAQPVSRRARRERRGGEQFR